MTVQAFPDIIGAVIAHLRASPEIAALTSTRISSERQTTWTLPGYAVLVQGPRGGPGDLGSALYGVRLDLRCYGPTPLNATLLWRTLNAYLLVPDGSRAVGFRQAQTNVYTVQAEGGPLRFVDPESKWPSTDATYLFTFSGVPVP